MFIFQNFNFNIPEFDIQTEKTNIKYCAKNARQLHLYITCMWTHILYISTEYSKAEQSRRLFYIFDNEFIDRRCQSTVVVDCLIKVALSLVVFKFKFVTDTVTLSMRKKRNIVVVSVVVSFKFVINIWKIVHFIIFCKNRKSKVICVKIFAKTVSSARFLRVYGKTA